MRAFMCAYLRKCAHNVTTSGPDANPSGRTIYNGNFGDHVMQRLAPTALIMFNDAILRTAFELGLPAIELRIVCSELEDYANPIEPSVQGGHKIAKAIIRAVEGQEGARGAPVFV